MMSMLKAIVALLPFRLREGSGVGSCAIGAALAVDRPTPSPSRKRAGDQLPQSVDQEFHLGPLKTD